MDSIVKELEIQKNYLQNQVVETIYFGGGTPSLLPPESLGQILACIYNNFSINNPELTLECNPDDINNATIKQWKSAGINRLSIGVQSFYDEDLQWMNRAHNSSQADSAIKTAQDAGLTNITIDLIYGTPAMSDDKWMNNIQTATRLQLPHLSCYALTVEPKTALDSLIRKGAKQPVDAEMQSRQFDILMQMAADAGYDHYEISNFAQPGFHSKHNSSYWMGQHYLGVGPSAHSYNGISRQWNVANNSRYVKSLVEGIVPYEIESLTPQQQLNEYIMVSLRTSKGISIEWLNNLLLQLSLEHNVEAVVLKYIQQGKMLLNNGYYRLTNLGKHFADGIAADLFI